MSSRRELVRSDLALVAALAAVACVAAGFVPSALVVVRALLALPLVLALPGYAIAAALFGGRELRVAERALFSVVLSLTATVIAALVLDTAGIALNAAPWMGVLAAVTIAGCAAAAVRGHLKALSRPQVRLRPLEAVALAGAVVLLAGAAALGFTPLHAPKDISDATSFVQTVPARNDTAVNLAVISDELRPATYSLALTVDGRPFAQFGPIRLKPGGSWQRIVAVGSGKPLVVAQLRKTGSNTTWIGYLSCWCSPPAKLPRRESH